MKKLPLFYYPTTILIVDDDSFFVSAVQEIFNGKWKTIPFLSSTECIDFIRSYCESSTHMRLLYGQTEHENFEALQHSPVDFDVTTLKSILENKGRHEEVSLILVDYNLKKINGIELSKKINNPFIKKMLLTGSSLDKEVIEAFNNNFIDKFIQKGKEETEDKILQYSEELILEYFNMLSAPLFSHLETIASLPQSDSIFVELFSEIVYEKDITEYYLIDKNGSYLCIDKNGGQFCLIVYTDRSISSWIDLNGEGLSDTETQDILRGTRIPFFGVSKEAWEIDRKTWSSHFYKSLRLKGSLETYYWAWIPLNKNEEL